MQYEGSILSELKSHRVVPRNFGLLNGYVFQTLAASMGQAGNAET